MVADSGIQSCLTPSLYSADSELVHAQQQQRIANSQSHWLKALVLKGYSLPILNHLPKANVSPWKTQKALSTVVDYVERHLMALHRPDRIVEGSLLKQIGLSEKEL